MKTATDATNYNPDFASKKEEDQFLKGMDTIDKDIGVESKKYARLEETNSSLTGEAWEIAIIAFWKPKTGKKGRPMKCYHYFCLPYPMTRQIGSTSKGIPIYTVLYTGMKGEVFCFFDNNYSEKGSNDTFTNMSVCELNLRVPSSKELRQNSKTKHVVHAPETNAIITPILQ